MPGLARHRGTAVLLREMGPQHAPRSPRPPTQSAGLCTVSGLDMCPSQPPSRSFISTQPDRSPVAPGSTHYHSIHTEHTLCLSGCRFWCPSPRPPPPTPHHSSIASPDCSSCTGLYQCVGRVSCRACRDGRVGRQLPCRPCRVGRRLSAVNILRILLSLAPPPLRFTPRLGVLCPLSLVQLVV